jgi:hypothetical protein
MHPDPRVAIASKNNSLQRERVGGFSGSNPPPKFESPHKFQSSHSSTNFLQPKPFEHPLLVLFDTNAVLASRASMMFWCGVTIFIVQRLLVLVVDFARTYLPLEEGE